MKRTILALALASCASIAALLLPSTVHAGESVAINATFGIEWTQVNWSNPTYRITQTRGAAGLPNGSIIAIETLGHSNAFTQATELGGQELQRSYGMGLGTHQQGLADVGALQNLGIGFQTPQAPNYQAPNMPFVTPSELQLALEQLKLQRQQLSRSGGGGGGGGAAPQAPSPFNAGLPPGYSGGVA